MALNTNTRKHFQLLAVVIALTSLSSYAFAISPSPSASASQWIKMKNNNNKQNKLLPRQHQQFPRSPVLLASTSSAIDSHSQSHSQSQSQLYEALAGGDSTMATSTFNLAKSIIGAGVLSLPSGVAFFSSDPKALIPSSIICAIFGLVAAYSFSTIGKVCKETRSKSFQDAWANTVDRKSAWTITASITAMCFLASLAYSIIIGDSFTSLAQTFNVPAAFAQRSSVIIALTLAVLFPMCSLKNLSALAPFSLLGLAGTLFTGIFMAIRFFDGSYAAGGKYFDSLPAIPVFTNNGFTLNHLTFVLLSMLSTSYIAHYNAPKFYNELQNPTMARFNSVVGGAFGASIAFFIFVMVIGYSTFGGNTMGFVLNNYSSADSMATIARFAIGLALLTGYPFTFSALREGIFDMLKVPQQSRAKSFFPVTVGLLSVVTLMAMALKDVGFVVSISGALFGCMLMFVVPAIMNIKLLAANGGNKLEVLFNYGMVGTGITMAILGVYVSVMKQLGQL